MASYAEPDVDEAPFGILPVNKSNAQQLHEKSTLKSDHELKIKVLPPHEAWNSYSNLQVFVAILGLFGYTIFKNMSAAENAVLTCSSSVDSSGKSDSKMRSVRENIIRNIIKTKYWPNLFCMNRDMSTIMGYIRKCPPISTRRELIKTEAGGRVGLDWTEWTPSLSITPWTPSTPTLLLIHGLNGHSEESYIRYMMQLAHQKGWRSVAFNHRGCGNTKLYTPVGYNGAFTGDIRAAVCHIKRRWPDSTLYAAGFSLGANLLVKYLGEEGDATPVAGAVAVSNPWDFQKNEEVAKGTTLHGLAYSVALTHELKKYIRQHRAVFESSKDIDVDEILRCLTIREFDEKATVPVWGYENVKAYHEDSVSADYVPKVKIPLLAIQALDDPVVSRRGIPYDHFRTNPNTFLVTTERGGHIGWGEGTSNPLLNASWAEKLTISFLSELHTAISPSSSNEQTFQNQGALGTMKIPSQPLSKL
mmetsp:Transcript_30101/g.39635  ORF Transcript_30101/g.39635 Transcript_30101/m.39635 type:complete len:474 (+) Transcript_30101:170-1591(+)